MVRRSMGNRSKKARFSMATPEVNENGMAVPEVTENDTVVPEVKVINDNSTAAPEAKQEMCIMCLETPAVTKVEICQHSFCEGCLTSHNPEANAEALICPACEVKPVDENEEIKENEADRVLLGKSVADGDDKENTKVDGFDMTSPNPVVHVVDQIKVMGPFLEGNCKLCHYQGNVVKAIKACEECQRLPLCVNCIDGHRANKATKDHVIAPLGVLKRRRDALCDDHKESLDTFCATCSKFLCHVCLSMGHAEHVIEALNDVIHVKVEEMRRALEYEEKRFRQLKNDEKMLVKSKETAVKMEDYLIKLIEDHAEECIDEILKNKETLKRQLKSDFAVIGVLTKRVEAMPELLRVSEERKGSGEYLLNDGAELQPTYVEKLKALLKELDHLKGNHPGYWLDKREYQKEFESLCEKAPKFFPRKPNLDIGGFKDPGPSCKNGGACVCEICQQATNKPQ
ncbi:tripartite motif-containing protein 42-like [Lineus longissimus]|uniref:tripartite motif-containing protein 42-like n=1 Tax=Lineus longissimus TaxID=88925 RepID=UPI00315C82C2